VEQADFLTFAGVSEKGEPRTHERPPRTALKFVIEDKEVCHAEYDLVDRPGSTCRGS
jgi:hypothetical protein